VTPVGHLLDDFLGDPRDGVLAEVHSIGLIEERLDLTCRQTPRRQREHGIVDPGQPPLSLLHDDRLEAALPVAGHLDLDRADLGQHRLRPGPVTRVGPVPPSRIVLVVAEMLGQLGLQRGLEDLLGQPGEQATRTGQIDPPARARSTSSCAYC